MKDTEIIIESSKDSAVGYDTATGSLFVLSGRSLESGEWICRTEVDDLASAALLHCPFILEGPDAGYVSQLYPDLDSDTCFAVAYDATCDLASSEYYWDLISEQVMAEVEAMHFNQAESLMKITGATDLAALARALEGNYGLPYYDECGIMTCREEVMAVIRRSIEETGDADEVLMRAAKEVRPNSIACFNSSGVNYIHTAAELCFAFGSDLETVYKKAARMQSPSEAASRAAAAAARHTETAESTGAYVRNAVDKI